jgi:hypothetical protein
MRTHHLAQINVSRMLAPLESPVMAGFVGQLEAVNAVADRSPGFVWRFQTEEGNATYVRPFDDELIIVNISVWESIEALRQYVYHDVHATVLRNRNLWFSRMNEAHLAMWWIPTGTLPTIDQARERLEHLRRHGETPFAFTFRHPFAEPRLPDLDGRVLVTASSTGDCTAETRFRYTQRGESVAATYEGGAIRAGSLAAVVRDGTLDVTYTHLTAAGTLRRGECETIPELLADGRIRLHESWRWLGSGAPREYAVVEEVA